MTAPATLLIVEDSALQREMLKRTLVQAGYRTTTATNGVEGLAMARKLLEEGTPPDLIISDIAMPSMDGYQLCRAIKGDPRLRNTPVMLLTDLSDAREIVQGLESGADNYLTKPYDEEDLLARLSFLLQATEGVEPESPTEEGSREEGLAVTRERMSFSFDGERYEINSNRRQILNLLLSTYENAVRKNRQLLRTQLELRLLNDQLEEKVRERTSQLEAANRAKSQFVANISHELRTPMNAIIGMTDLTLDTALQEDQRKMLTIVHSSAAALLVLLNSLLDFARLETGTLTLQSVEFGLREWLASIAALSAKRAGEKGLHFTCLVPSGVPERWWGDPGVLRQIVGQLLDNAIKFTEEGGVTLRVAQGSGAVPDGRSPSRLALVVEDTGIGIDEDQFERIFEAFAQGDGSSTRRYGGTGLGLSLSRRLAALLGGTILVARNEGGGHTHPGSRFTLEVALSPPPQQVSSAMENVSTQLFRLDFPPPFAEPGTEPRTPIDPALLSYEQLLRESAYKLLTIEKALREGLGSGWDSSLAWLKKAADLMDQAAMREDLLRLSMAARKDDHAKALEHLTKVRQYLQGCLRQ